ncbi:MAG: aspartyl-tRNA(Asn)/glutamyl-tRNA(Gln) amidotransferase subunit [Actinomycetota bacterium]|jgi:aspartyl-tRNA(Asn)/glutamyl-tRNA(Gln) amidotransferase subunit A|nr:aspartyl-tRNA(Asn)/glutamyl-tRNA(Gln) amidotransferase subunit [Actinomycetota bacterium]
MTDLCDRTGIELAGMLAAGEITAVELAESSLARVEAVDDRVGAFLTKTPQVALERAAELDAYLSTGAPQSSVAGIPLALKDVLTTNGIRTTAGSKMLETYVPPYDCTAWTRLSGAGSVLIGKTNCDEFAMGSSNENSAFGPVHNPWDLDAVPGGSSGGSAAAVAAGEAVWALGTDTGGSVRQPAALCGVVGLKPTYGLISRYGLIAFASSLDTVGTFTRSTRDAAALLSVLAGKDHRDATSVDTEPRDFTEGIDAGVQGLRVGVVSEGYGEGVHPDVAGSVRAAVERLSGLGAHVGEVSLPHTDYALSAYYLIAPSEASSNLARYDGVRFGYRAEGGTDVEDMMSRTRGAGFGPEVKRRIMLGTYSLSAGYYDAYYGQAQKVRTLIIGDYEAAFANYDVLVSPTSPTTAFKIGERADDPMAMYLSDVFTIPANLAGVPAISIPSGFDGTGLPIGLQFTAPVLGESTVFRAAHALETDLGLDLRPPLLAGV